MDKVIDKKHNATLFLKLLKEFNTNTYQEIVDKQLVLDVFIGKSRDTPVIIKPTGINTNIDPSVNSKVALAYESITGKSCSIFYEYVTKETLNKYDSLEDYFRIQKAELEKKRLKDKEIIQKYKMEYELLTNNPFDIIQQQQKEIEDLNKEIDKLKKKRRLLWWNT